MGEGPPDRTAAQIENLRVLFAPAASRVDAIIDDPEALRIAERIIAAMEGLDEPTTRGGILAAAGLEDEGLARSRFNLFVGMGMLRKVRGDKPHQQRYYLHPAALIGGELLARLAERGAIAELHDLLVAAADRVESEDVEPWEARQLMQRVAAVLRSYAQQLEDVVAHGTVEEMLEVRVGHHANRHFEAVRRLASAVRHHFPELRDAGFRMVKAGQRYHAAVTGLVQRATRTVASRPEGSLFALLPSDRYRDAAIDSGHEALAGVLEGIVVDPARPVVDLPLLASAADHLAAEPSERVVPTEPDPGSDPVAELNDRLDRHRRRQAARAGRFDLILADADRADVSDQLLWWPKAAILLADLLALARDPDQPWAIDVADVQVVEPDQEVALRFWVRVRRLGEGTVDRRDGGMRPEAGREVAS